MDRAMLITWRITDDSLEELLWRIQEFSRGRECLPEEFPFRRDGNYDSYQNSIRTQCVLDSFQRPHWEKRTPCDPRW